MNATALWSDYVAKAGTEDDAMDTLVAKALSHVVNKYFAVMVPAFMMILSCHYKNINDFTGMLGKLYPIWGTPVLQLTYQCETQAERIYGNRRYNLVIIDSYVGFLELDLASYSLHHDYNEYYYIFLKVRDHRQVAEMRRIFKYCWRKYLINCSIQVETMKGEVLLYTYFPFTARSCNSVEPVLINRFNGTAMVDGEIFPKKLRNCHGCPMRAALYHIPPFLYLTTHENGTHEITGGFEGKLLKLLADSLNFRLEIMVPPKNEKTGVVFPNGSANGVFGLLTQNKADLTMGAISHTQQRVKVSSPTSTYYQSQEAVVGLVAAFEMTSSEIFIYPFNAFTWCALSAILVACAVVLALLQRYSRHLPQMLAMPGDQPTFLDVVLITTGMPLSRISQWHFRRLFTITTILFALLMRNYYQAMMFHLIRINTGKRFPSLLEELGKHDYRVIVDESTFDVLRHIPMFDSVRMDIVNSTEGQNVYQYLEETANRNVVAAGPYDFIDHYVRTHKKAGVFRNMANKIMNIEITMFVQKHSFLLDQVNDLLVWIRVMGFMRFWLKQDLDRSYFESSHMHTDRILKLEELYVIFCGWFVLIGLAVLVFVCELLSKRFRVLARLFEQ